MAIFVFFFLHKNPSETTMGTYRQICGYTEHRCIHARSLWLGACITDKQTHYYDQQRLMSVRCKGFFSFDFLRTSLCVAPTRLFILRLPFRRKKMVHHGTMITLLLVGIALASEVAGVRYVPKWKKQVNSSNWFPSISCWNVFSSFGQACEIPASQNEQSHYTCDDNGDLKCLPGACWNG